MSRGFAANGRTSDVLVLCYHAVSDRWESELAVRPGQLREQLELLLRRGYVGAGFTDSVTDSPARKTLAVTFDDAFGSVLELAFPVMSRLGLPGTVFVPTDFADERRTLCWPGIDHWVGGEHESEVRVLGWDELERLRDAGWEVGSHARSHPRLTSLDDAALEDELAGSRDACERRLGRPCESIAYPYGDVDRRVLEAARAAGYRAGAALPAGLHRQTPLEWPRIGVYRDDTLGRFRLKASRHVRRLRIAIQGRGR